MQIIVSYSNSVIRGFVWDNTLPEGVSSEDWQLIEYDETSIAPPAFDNLGKSPQATWQDNQIVWADG
tara:strand:- start:47 stop:247 length:201 start_codon:yes stop_codon:yes gene_type:complete